MNMPSIKLPPPFVRLLPPLALPAAGAAAPWLAAVAAGGPRLVAASQSAVDGSAAALGVPPLLPGRATSGAAPLVLPPPLARSIVAKISRTAFIAVLNWGPFSSGATSSGASTGSTCGNGKRSSGTGSSFSFGHSSRAACAHKAWAFRGHPIPAGGPLQHLTAQQPAAAASSGQQQPAAATSSSRQQQAAGAKWLSSGGLARRRPLAPSLPPAGHPTAWPAPRPAPARTCRWPRSCQQRRSAQMKAQK